MPQQLIDPDSIEKVRLLTVNEVTKTLRVHRKTLWRYAKDKGPSALRPLKLQHGAIRYHEGEVMEWLKRNRV